MELNHLRYFYEVAKAGSFTEAARHLRISQSALSKSVALLENAEGVKLLERSKKGVTLTSLGVQVYAKSEQLFQVVSEIESTCKGTQEVCEGLLRLGASDHIVNYFLIDKVKQMRAQHPRVVPSIFSGAPVEVVEQILKGEIEFGLFFTKFDAPGLTYEPISTIEMAIVCHPKLLKNAEQLSLSKLRALLKGQGLIGSIKSQYQKHPSKVLIDLMGPKPNITFESNSQETQKRFCLQGGGIAFLARFMVQKEIDQGQLTEIKIGKPLTYNLLLVKKKSVPHSMAARVFMQLCKDQPMLS